MELEHPAAWQSALDEPLGFGEAGDGPGSDRIEHVADRSGIAANSMAAAKKYRGFQAMDRFSSEWGVSLV